MLNDRTYLAKPTAVYAKQYQVRYIKRICQEKEINQTNLIQFLCSQTIMLEMQNHYFKISFGNIENYYQYIYPQS